MDLQHQTNTALQRNGNVASGGEDISQCSLAVGIFTGKSLIEHYSRRMDLIQNDSRRPA